MKSTFTTIHGTKFESNDSYTYFYATFTNRVTGQITKKRISKHDFEQAQREDKLEKAYVERKAIEEEAEKAIAEQDAKQELEDELLKAAEDPTVSVEEFVDMITTPKAKKSTKKSTKKAAYEWSNGGVKVTLTEKQVDFIKHLPDTNFWEDGLDSCVWVDVLCDEIGGQFAGKPMTVGAMISTLCEKGLGSRARDTHRVGKPVSFELTPIGKAVAKDLGLR